MAALVIDKVVKRFPKAQYNAVDHLSAEIAEGELIAIVGTSGCGKTTLLKMVNRLCEPDSGTITLFGENIMDKDPVILRHGIGYVIQQIGLFPHMTVAENIAVVPRILKWEKDRIKARTEELLRLVNLDPAEFSKRYPVQLSGGQQQRVGLARALAADPKVMLLDEPFGAIDAINRINLQNELLQIHQKLRGTYLFVTHDMNEAFKMGNRVLIMHQGLIQQFDTPENTIRNPANDFVRNLIASSGAASSGAAGYGYGGEGI
jgi:osmoprotectant transport system ATP-binding protein